MLHYLFKVGRGNWYIYFLLFLFGFLAVLSIVLVHDYSSYIKEQQSHFRASIQHAARVENQYLEELLMQEINPLVVLSNQTDLQALDRNYFMQEIESIIEQKNFFEAIGLYYLSNENNQELSSGKSFVFSKLGVDDYVVKYPEFSSYKGKSWFKQAQKKKQSSWSEPYKNHDVEMPLIAFAIPIYLMNQELGKYQKQALLVGELNLARLAEFCDKVSAEKDGQLLLFSEKGIALYHPVNEYVHDMYSIEHIAQRNGQMILRDLVPQMLAEFNQERIVGDLEDLKESNEYYEYATYVKMQNFGWNLVVLGQNFEQIKTSLILQKKLVSVVLCSVFTLLVLFVLIGYLFNTIEFLLWILVFLSSLIFVSLTAFIWILNDFQSPRVCVKKYGEIIENYQQSSHFLKSVVRDLPDGFALLENSVKTGIFIENFEIEKDSIVTLSGYLWHQFNVDTQQQFLDRDEPLVMFQGVRSSSFTKTSQVEEKNTATLSWNFNVSFKPDFDYQLYPLDHQAISLHMRSIDLAHPVIIAHDFSVVRWQNSHKFKEISEQIMLSGWEIEKVYKGYSLTNFPVSFGMNEPLIQNKFPELMLHIVLYRRFASIMLGALLPIILTLLMLFVSIMINPSSSSDGSLMRHVSFAGASTLATIIPHVSIRNLFPFNVPYVEYFYFATYIFIFIVLINSILVSSKISYRIIAYRDNFFLKLFYWPFVTFFFFLITFLHFC